MRSTHDISPRSSRVSFRTRGNTFEEVTAELSRKLKEFVGVQYKENQTEVDAFAKATGNGANKKKVRELAAEIKKRLEAMPAATVPFTENAVASSPSPLAAPVPTTSVSPTATAIPVLPP